MRRLLSSACIMLLFSLLVPAARAQSGDGFVDVSIGLFSHRAPVPVVTATTERDAATATISTPAKQVEAVRAAETRFLPMYLRYRLEQTMRFGAVRVLPVPDNGAELRISGEIIRSDGAVLELAIKASDSTGRIWLDRSFSGSAISSETLSDDAIAEDAFASLFASIARELQQALDILTTDEVTRIETVALLRYGLGLVPTAFAAYLEEDGNGTAMIKRLPAADDPILTRILAIREREYLFIDVVDEAYGRFYTDVKPVYDLWRQFQREQADSSAARTARELATSSDYAPGSYRALQESYNNYRWAKLQELYVDELGQGFTNEVAPTQLQLDDSVFRLNGTLEQQYREWRRILAELFALETRQ